MRWLVLLAALAWTAPAAAQTTKFGGGVPALGITLQSPTDIDCGPPSGSCKPLNVAACDDAEGATRPFEVTIPPFAIPYTTEARLYVWVQEMQTTSTATGITVPNCTFDTGTDTHTSIDGYLSVNVFGTGPLTSENFDFPADLSTSLSLTAGDFLRATGPLAGGKIVSDACSTGVEKQYLLCFGLDYTGVNNTLAADGQVTPAQREPTAWVEVDVDTVPPPNVTAVTAAPGDGNVSLAPTTSAGVEDSDDWFAAVRPIADAADATDTDCREWTDAARSTTVAATETKFELGGLENGKTYEGCVALVDAAGNPSEGFASFVAEPFNQCDFAECYPGQLKTGCAAAGPTPLAAALALLLLGRRVRKERA